MYLVNCHRNTTDDLRHEILHALGIKHPVPYIFNNDTGFNSDPGPFFGIDPTNKYTVTSNTTTGFPLGGLQLYDIAITVTVCITVTVY